MDLSDRRTALSQFPQTISGIFILFNLYEMQMKELLRCCSLIYILFPD